MTAHHRRATTPSRPSLDHYTRLVQRVVGAPIALVTVLEDDDQVFLGATGLDAELDETRRTPLSTSVCRYVIGSGEPLVVEDARTDPLLQGHPGVAELGVVGYAGFPIRGDDERVVGSLCAVDLEPRTWTEDELATLEDLASACSAELQQVRRQLASSRALTEALLDMIDVVVVLYDADGRLVLANQQARDAAAAGGIDLDSPTRGGAHVRRADNRTPVPPEEQMLSRAMRGEEADSDIVWFGEFGRERAAMTRVRQLHDRAGRAWGTLVTAQDITELARAMQVKESFVSSVSHELRTPLTAVLGYAELLEEEIEGFDSDTTSALHALGVIQRRALDLQARIGDLLDMTDLRRRLTLVSTDISELARRVLSTFAEPAFAAGHTLDLEASFPQRAVVDERHVTQLLENLVSNALKHTDSGGRVVVRVAGDAEVVSLEVADNGRGMSSTDADQAFDKFWRAAQTHEDAVPGIGIGLSLVRDIVTAHHGSVWLESEPGRGTTVHVELPRSPAAVI